MKKILFTILFLFQVGLCPAQVPVNLEGIQGPGGQEILTAHVHPFELNNGVHNGVVAQVHPLLVLDPEFHPFLNPVNGTDMAVNASFGGIAAFVYEDGDSSDADSGTATAGTGFKSLTDTGQNFQTTVSVGMVVKNTVSGNEYAHVTIVTSDTVLALDNDILISGETFTIGAEWPGTVVSGGWNFTTDISITGANNGDEAQFDNEHTSVMSNYVAVTGKITLTTWNEVNNQILLSFGLSDVLVGNTVDLNNFIDTGLLGTQQNFVIPKTDLGLTTQTVDDMNLLILRTGGAKPTVDLDDIQLESTGGSLIYKATTPKDTRFHITEIRIALADNITSVVTNGTMQGLAYDDFMGITSPLTNGLVFSRFKDSETVFTATFRQIGDFLSTGSNIVNAISDGTNTFITLLIEFPEPIILDGSKGDFLSFTLSDDYSVLLQMTAAARGGIEK